MHLKPNWIIELAGFFLMFLLSGFIIYFLYLDNALTDFLATQNHNHKLMLNLIQRKEDEKQDKMVTKNLQRWNTQTPDEYRLMLQSFSENGFLQMVTDNVRHANLILINAKLGLKNTVQLSLLGSFRNFFNLINLLNALPYPILINSAELKQDKNLTIELLVQGKDDESIRAH